MARRKAAQKRTILPDPLFGSELLTHFINVVMRSGKKSISEKIVYGALEQVWERSKKVAKKAKVEDEGGESDAGITGSGNIRTDASARKRVLEIFNESLDNVRPAVEVKSRRVGGATYQVPIEVREDRAITLAMRWIVQSASSRGEKTMVLRLAGEILDAREGRGGAIKKRETVHSMAKANQAFAHFRW